MVLSFFLVAVNFFRNSGGSGARGFGIVGGSICGGSGVRSASNVCE